jgi:methionine-rich copper-binding protein CopC
MPRFGRLSLIPALLMLAGAVPDAQPGLPSADVAHFALESSSPAAGATVPAPAQLRLTFTQEPADGTVSIRVLEAGDAGVHALDVTQDEEDPRSFVVGFHGTFPAGTYTVSWRGMGADGHVVRDTFQFTVQAD